MTLVVPPGGPIAIAAIPLNEKRALTSSLPGSDAPHRYGEAHRKVRRRWAPKVRAGKVQCARYGEPIHPGENGGIWITTTTIRSSAAIWPPL